MTAVAVLLGASGTGCTDAPVVENSQFYASVGLSNFEIDTDANLVVDGASPAIDWVSVTEIRKDDAPSGQGDDSYKGGAKEDDPCPSTGTGSIPNNKSDLKTFGVYEEPGDPGYLHVFWTRVQDPSGTTLLDFEFNQSDVDCGNGVNPVRTEGDLLLEYRIENGGAVATLKLREWELPGQWGSALDVTSTGDAIGDINETTILVGDSDGLGQLDPRTFGEASIDLDVIFDEDKCESFGSAFVKSRSSDAFNSALKDYIAPAPIELTNCGKVIIRKQTDPDKSSGVTGTFGFTKTFGTYPSSGDTFTLGDDDVETFDGVLFGTSYTVTEDVLPTGWELTSVDCSASTGVTPAIVDGTVTFDIDADDDILDCTYHNRANGKIIVEKVSNDGAQAFPFSSTTLTPAAFTLTTTGSGQAGKDSRTFDDLTPGTYDVAETIPTGWNLVSATCDDGSPPSAVAVAAGETVTCTFVNELERGYIRIHKTRKHKALGTGDHDHAGVTFQVTGGIPVTTTSVTTNSSGIACLGGLVVSTLAGQYTVTENPVPTGYTPAGPVSKLVSVTEAADCGSGNLVSFSNIPLTNITVSVDSQIEGGTASDITCSFGSASTNPSTGDGSLTGLNLAPATYTCSIVVDP